MSKSKPRSPKKPSSFPSDLPEKDLPNLDNSKLWTSVYSVVEGWASIVCQGQDHRDIMQDVMEKALTTAPQDHPNPVAWFRASVRNRYLNIIRDTELRKGAAISTPSGNYQIASIDEALSGVDWFDAEVFRLHYIHGVSVRAISYQIECPASTVYDAINKASNIVKQRLSL